MSGLAKPSAALIVLTIMATAIALLLLPVAAASADMAVFREMVTATLRDLKGWTLDGAVSYVPVDDNERAYLARLSPGGRERRAGSLTAYRHYVISWSTATAMTSITHAEPRRMRRERTSASGEGSGNDRTVAGVQPRSDGEETS